MLTTYGQLGAILNDLERYIKTSPAFEVFHKEKIRRFYQQNAMRIDIFNKRKNKLFEANVKKDEKGEFYLQVEVGDHKEWDFISENHKADFEKEAEEFMGLSFDLHI